MHTVSLVLFFNSWKTFLIPSCSVSKMRRAKLLDFDFSDSFEDSDSAIYQTSNCCLKKIFILCSSRQQGHHHRLESFLPKIWQETKLFTISHIKPLTVADLFFRVKLKSMKTAIISHHMFKMRKNTINIFLNVICVETFVT